MTPDVFFLFKKRLNAIQYNLLEITATYDDIISNNEIYDISFSEMLKIETIKKCMKILFLIKLLCKKKFII